MTPKFLLITTVVNPATLDVKSMVGRNYSGGCGGKVLEIGKICRRPHCTLVDNGASGGFSDGNGVAMWTCKMVWFGMVWYGIEWYGMVWYGMAWWDMAI